MNELERNYRKQQNHGGSRMLFGIDGDVADLGDGKSRGT